MADSTHVSLDLDAISSVVRGDPVGSMAPQARVLFGDGTVLSLHWTEMGGPRALGSWLCGLSGAQAIPEEVDHG